MFTCQNHACFLDSWLCVLSNSTYATTDPTEAQAPHQLFPMTAKSCQSAKKDDFGTLDSQEPETLRCRLVSTGVLQRLVNVRCQPHSNQCTATGGLPDPGNTLHSLVDHQTDAIRATHGAVHHPSTLQPARARQERVECEEVRPPGPRLPLSAAMA